MSLFTQLPSHRRKTFSGGVNKWRAMPMGNNRKWTRGRAFSVIPIGKGVFRKMDQADHNLPKQKPQPYVGIADFGALNRGYHLNGSRRDRK